MKDKIIDFVLLHIPHVLSALTYSFIEYRIGISKKIQENSLLEIIKNRLFKE